MLVGDYTLAAIHIVCRRVTLTAVLMNVFSDMGGGGGVYVIFLVIVFMDLFRAIS